MGSDHAPIMFQGARFSSKRQNRSRHFYFEAMWIRDEGCENVVKKAWNKLSLTQNSPVDVKLNFCAEQLKNWNRSTFGNVNNLLKENNQKLTNI